MPTALKFLDKGLLDRLIVCEDDDWGKVGTPQTALPDARLDSALTSGLAAVEPANRGSP